MGNIEVGSEMHRDEMIWCGIYFKTFKQRNHRKKPKCSYVKSVMSIMGLLFSMFENFMIKYWKYLDQQFQRGFNGSGDFGDGRLYCVCPMSFSSPIWLASSCGSHFGVCDDCLYSVLCFSYTIWWRTSFRNGILRGMECEFPRSCISENTSVLFS